MPIVNLDAARKVRKARLLGEKAAAQGNWQEAREWLEYANDVKAKDVIIPETDIEMKESETNERVSS